MSKSQPDLKIQTNTLKTTLNMVSKAAQAKSALPILSSIHMNCDANSQEVTFSATDTETAISMRVSGAVERSFSTCAPATTLTSLAGAVGGEETEFTFEGETVTLNMKSLSTKSKIKCLDGDEFPKVTPPKSSEMGKLPAKVLKAALKRVAIAASADESRPALCSVELSMQKDQVFLAAADGFRLAVYRLDESTITFPGKTSLLIPRNSVTKLLSILPDGESEVTISNMNDQVILFAWESVMFRAQLLDFQFPEWPKIIPNDWEHELTFKLEDLQGAVKRAEVFAREANHVLRVFPGTSSGTRIFSESTSGKGETLIEGVDMPIPMSFNSTFVRQGLDVIQATPVHIRVNKKNAPMLMTNGTDKFRYLIMPMHTDDDVIKAAQAAQASETAQAQ